MCCMTTLTPWQFYLIITWIKPRDSESCQWNGYQVRQGQEVEAPVKQTSTLGCWYQDLTEDLLSKSYAIKSCFKTKDFNVVSQFPTCWLLASLLQKMMKIRNFPLQQDPEDPKHQQYGEIYLCPPKWQRSIHLLFCIIWFQRIHVSIFC